jgi:hypothetical protein
MPWQSSPESLFPIIAESSGNRDHQKSSPPRRKPGPIHPRRGAEKWTPDRAASRLVRRSDFVNAHAALGRAIKH